MNLIDYLVEKGKAEAADRADDWFNDLLDKAFVLAGNWDEEEASFAREGLAILEDHSGALLGLGSEALLGVLTTYHVGDVVKARHTYLKNYASFAELMAISRDAADKVVVERVEMEAAWSEVKTMLQELGSLLWRVIPLLLAAA